MGKPAAGQAFLEESLRLDPDLVPANVAMADTLMERGRNQEALKFLERASLKKADDAGVQLKLGQLCLDLKRYDASLNALTTAERLSPNEKKTHYLLGRLYTATRRPELAQKEFAIFKSLESAQTKNGMAK